MKFFFNWYCEWNWIGWAKKSEGKSYPSSKLICIFSFKLLNRWLISFWTIFGVYSSEQPYESYQSWLLLLLWTCFKEEGGRYGLFVVAAQRYCWEEPREGTGRREQAKKCTPGNQQARTEQELCSLPRSKNKLRSNRTFSSFLYNSENYTESQARLRGLKASRGAKKGPKVPRECAGASETTRDSIKQSWELHKCAQLTT